MITDHIRKIFQGRSTACKNDASSELHIALLDAIIDILQYFIDTSLYDLVQFALLDLLHSHSIRFLHHDSRIVFSVHRSTGVVDLDSLSLFLHDVQIHDIFCDQIASKRNHAQIDQFSTFEDRNGGYASTEIHQGTTQLLLVVIQYDISQSQWRNKYAGHVNASLLLDAVVYILLDRRATDDQLVASFDAFARNADRIGFNFIIQIIGGRNDIQYRQEIGTKFEALFIQSIYRFIRYIAGVSKDLADLMIHGANGLTSHAYINLSDFRTIELVLQFEDKSFDFVGSLLYVVNGASANAVLRIFHLIGEN